MGLGGGLMWGVLKHVPVIAFCLAARSKKLLEYVPNLCLCCFRCFEIIATCGDMRDVKRIGWNLIGCQVNGAPVATAFTG